MMDIPAHKIAVIGCIVALWIAFGAWCWLMDRKHWNGGVSPRGRPWVLFDHDSQGGRGYVDDPQWGPDTHICWISWPGIDL